MRQDGRKRGRFKRALGPKMLGICARPVYADRRASVRRLLNTVCCFLVLATYLWGGCVSCEQFFMVPGAKDDCCKHGKCKQSSQSGQKESQSSEAERSCATMPFAHQDSDTTLAAVALDLPVRLIPAAELFSFNDVRWQRVPHFDPLADSPPDLVLLTGSFLI